MIDERTLKHLLKLRNSTSNLLPGLSKVTAETDFYAVLHDCLPELIGCVDGTLLNRANGFDYTIQNLKENFEEKDRKLKREVKNLKSSNRALKTQITERNKTIVIRGNDITELKRDVFLLKRDVFLLEREVQKRPTFLDIVKHKLLATKKIWFSYDNL